MFQNYLIWCDNDTYTNITKPRYGSVHPFPLNHILPYSRRQTVIKRLRALGWYEKSLDKVQNINLIIIDQGWKKEKTKYCTNTNFDPTGV